MPKRNVAFFDAWSIVHIITGIVLGWIMAPVIAFVMMVLWEPLEIFLLSPVLAHFGITYGFESLRNSLSDILFDAIGVIIGAFGLTLLAAPPFHLF
jgi:hypothetical protein